MMVVDQQQSGETFWAIADDLKQFDSDVVIPQQAVAELSRSDGL